MSPKRFPGPSWILKKSGRVAELSLSHALALFGAQTARQHGGPGAMNALPAFVHEKPFPLISLHYFEFVLPKYTF